MLLVLVESWHVIQGIKFAVHAHAGKALGLELLELVLMRALLQLYQRGHDHKLGALRQGQDVGNNFVGGAGLDGPSALRAVHAAKTRKKHAQKVVNFRYRSHRGTRVARNALLFKRYGGREALDLFHIGLVHLGQKLAGVGRKRFHIAALPLGIHNVKGEG